MRISRVLSVLGLSFLCLSTALSGEIGQATPYRLSPVYEEMLGNQVYSLWKNLIQRHLINGTAPFYVAGWNQSEGLAEKVTASLRRTHGGFCDWRLGSLDDWKGKKPFRGVILIGSADSNLAPASDFRKAAAFFIGSKENKGYLILFLKEAEQVAEFKPILKEAGLESKSVFALKEIEFAKDEWGRQVVDLDSPDYQYRIFEQLVREGMNPVRAHPMVEEAVKHFRNADKPKILIVGKRA